MPAEPNMLEMNEMMNDNFGVMMNGQPGAIGGGAQNMPQIISPPGHLQPGQPYVEISEHPKSRGFRFRYECEGRSAGSIPGEHSTNDNRTFPSIKIMNNPKNDAIVVVSCVTKDPPHYPHPHSLVGKDCKNNVCTVKLRKTNFATFANIGIQCAKRKEIKKMLKERKDIRVDPFQTGFDFDNNSIDLSVVRLCFQVFVPDENNRFTRPLKPVVSQPIYDKKTVTELSICRISRHAGSVAGGDEVFLLCEKVSKDDIEVRFFEEATDGSLIWEQRGEMGPQDVHRQFAIVFKTPQYRDLDLQQPKKVYLQLKRPSDGETSDPIEFNYSPLDPDPEGIDRKRKRKTFQLDQISEMSDFSGMMQSEESKTVRERLKVKVRGGKGKEPTIKKEAPSPSTSGIPDMAGLDLGAMSQTMLPGTYNLPHTPDLQQRIGGGPPQYDPSAMAPASGPSTAGGFTPIMYSSSQQQPTLNQLAHNPSLFNTGTIDFSQLDVSQMQQLQQQMNVEQDDAAHNILNMPEGDNTSLSFDSGLMAMLTETFLTPQQNQPNQ